MKFDLEDVYKTYSELKTEVQQFRESRYKSLLKLLGPEKASRAVFAVTDQDDLLTYLKESEDWQDEEKFLNEYVRGKKFLVGAEYTVYKATGWERQLGTAVVCSRTEIDGTTWVVLKYGPVGSEKVCLTKISFEDGMEKIYFEDLVLYSDCLAYKDSDFM